LHAMRDQRRPIKYAKHDMRLLQLLHQPPCELWSLAPSPAQVEAFFATLANLVPMPRATKLRAVAQSPNHASVVCWVGIGSLHILLGGDLQDRADSKLGWGAIVGSDTRPQGRAQIFKIPHHGSLNADNISVWDKMLSGAPIALVTPYARLMKPLPTEEDLNRIAGRTAHGFCTSRHPTHRYRHRTPTVNRTIREMGATVRELARLPSRVTVRISETGAAVELVGAAFQIGT
jgi:hypothetical protein